MHGRKSRNEWLAHGLEKGHANGCMKSKIVGICCSYPAVTAEPPKFTWLSGPMAAIPPLWTSALKLFAMLNCGVFTLNTAE